MSRSRKSGFAIGGDPFNECVFSSTFGGAARSHQLDRLFRARLHAQPTRAAQLGARRVRRLPAVGDVLELGEETERREVGRLDRQDAKHAVWADLYTLRFRFTLRSIDHRYELARL